MSPRAECLDCRDNISDPNSWNRLKGKLLMHHLDSERDGRHRCSGFSLYRNTYQPTDPKDDRAVGWAAFEHGKLVEWEFLVDLNPHQPPDIQET